MPLIDNVLYVWELVRYDPPNTLVQRLYILYPFSSI